jgi:hypothetical protein
MFYGRASWVHNKKERGLLGGLAGCDCISLQGE